MMMVAIEPKREVADWLRKRGDRFGLEIEVHPDLEKARPRLERDPVDLLAGYFGGGKAMIPRWPNGGRPSIVPFLAGSGTTEDHCDRWSLILPAVRGESVAPSVKGDLESLGKWIDARFEEELEARHRELVAGLEPVFLELSRRDPALRDHSFRVGVYAAGLGEAAGLSPLMVRLLKLGGWVHDVGKIHVRTAILRKSGMLEADERSNMREHPDRGARIIEERPVEREILGMVRHHHERFDGKGYPSLLEGEEIPLHARFLAVADTYDAMTSDRPYRLACDHRSAVREILACSGTQFDPAIVQALLVARLDRASSRITAA